MIGIVDVEVQALNPSMPLYPMRAFVSSPSSIRVRNVPKRIGKWCIENVSFVVAYPDGSIKSADCVLVGGVWTGTIDGTQTSGTSKNGYTIFASGTDENGNAVTGYILGKGDIEILEGDGTITPGEDIAYVHLLDEESSTPKEGDLYPTEDGYKIWQNGEGHLIGDDSGAIEELQKSKRDILDMSVRGLPEDESSWFVVDGTKVVNIGIDQWHGGDFDIIRHGDNQYGLEIEMASTSFVLDTSFTATVDGHTIVGYTSVIASQAWVEGNDYATRLWVSNQQYLTNVPVTYKTYTETVFSLSEDGYATKSWVEDKNYLLSVPNTYKTYNDTVSSLSNDGYATQSWVSNNASKVSLSNVLTTGTDIGTLTIDGVSTTLKAPAGGGSNGFDVTINSHVLDGVEGSGEIYVEGSQVNNEASSLKVNGTDSHIHTMTFHNMKFLTVPVNPFTYVDGVPKSSEVIFLTANATVDLYKYVCIAGGTLVSLADGTTKPIEDITYDDNLLVWNFDEGRLDCAKPSWIKKADYVFYYWNTQLKSGKSINTCGYFGHRLFDMSANTWTYASDIDGKTVYTLDGADEVVSSTRMDGKVNFYNIITKGHINLFGNGVLLGCSLENKLYPVENMKFIKDNRALRAYSEFEGEVPEWWYIDCRYAESNANKDYLVKYCKDRLPIMKDKS